MENLISGELIPFTIPDWPLNELDGPGRKLFTLHKEYKIGEIEKCFGDNKAYTWNTAIKKNLGTIQFGSMDKHAIIDGERYKIELFDTLRTWAYYGNFKPTIYEALEGIPFFTRMNGCTKYITTIFGGMSLTQQNHYGVTVLIYELDKKRKVEEEDE